MKDLIGEALFATRPWESFGEGQKNFNSIDRGSAADIRFTRNKANTILYVTTIGWPGDGVVLKVRTLNQYRINLKSLTGVSLVGTADPSRYSQDGEFLKITMPAKAPAGGSPTLNDPIDVLTDGKVVMGFGPIFPNGVDNGMYKLDLANVQPVAQVNTFSAGEGRARQNFLLYGSTAAADPGWNVTDATVFMPVNGVDTRLVKPTAFEATSIRRSNGRPLGNYRWLVWALSPLEDGIGGGNSSFQELQVIPATQRK